MSSGLNGAEFAKDGLASGTARILNERVHETEKGYDKMGVLQEVVHILHDDTLGAERVDDLQVLEDRLLELCRHIRREVFASQQAARRASGKQAIQRLIDDYFKTHKKSSSVFDIELLLERVQSESALLGEDGEPLDASLRRLINELGKVRASDQKLFDGDVWNRWKHVIQAIRKNPLNVAIVVTSDGPMPAEQTTPLPAEEVEVKAPPRGNAKETKKASEDVPS